MLNADEALAVCQGTFPQIHWQTRHSVSGLTTYIRTGRMPLGSFQLEDTHQEQGWKIFAHGKIMGFAGNVEDMETVLKQGAQYHLELGKQLAQALSD